ncbi:MAG TPA: transposase [Myxococcales bacterium]|nr:transposase [Myxococcales bacterium]
MKKAQQDLPFPQRGGARKGSGRKRKAPRPQVPHRPRLEFRNAAVHVTLRVCEEVWNLRTHRCFNAIRRGFERGCGKFGVRVIHFTVQGNHIHLIVEAADADSLARAMKGLQVSMARALNKVMKRRGRVFADRYHAHVLSSPVEAANAIRYVLDNWKHHACRDGRPVPIGIDPWCSAAWSRHTPSLVREPEWWMLKVGVGKFGRLAHAASDIVPRSNPPHVPARFAAV